MANVNRMLSRRSFLSRGATLVAAGWAVPSFIAETARLLDAGPDASVMAVPTARAAGNKILVIIQLAGGNDGLNMVIPYADPAYAAARPNIAIPSAQVLQLNSSVGLHPNFTRLKSRFDRGQMAVVQGVSYPNPNRSHFRGTDIWESAVPDRLEAKGWVGRYLENCGCQRADHLEAMTVGSSQTAGTFWTEMALVPAVASISSFRYTGVNSGSTTQRNSEIQTLRNGLAQAEGTPEGEFLRQSILTALTDADILAAAAGSYTPRGSYPSNGFGNAMKLVAQMIGANVGTQIYYVSLGGFDTHSGQVAAQASLFSTLDQAIEGFLTDMDGISRTSDVTLMTFSEFDVRDWRRAHRRPVRPLPEPDRPDQRRSEDAGRLPPGLRHGPSGLAGHVPEHCPRRRLRDAPDLRRRLPDAQSEPGTARPELWPPAHTGPRPGLADWRWPALGDGGGRGRKLAGDPLRGCPERHRRRAWWPERTR